LDRLVHEPARLAILVALSACEKAEFLFLLNITDQIACRDLPWRAYYAALILVAFWAPAVTDPSRMRGYLPAYVTGLIGLGVVGLLDHLLLARLMRRVKQPVPSA
jgi:hypothetical protein